MKSHPYGMRIQTMKKDYFRYKFILTVSALGVMAMLSACSEGTGNPTPEEPAEVVELNLNGTADDGGMSECGAADTDSSGNGVDADDDKDSESGGSSLAPDDGRTYVASDKNVQNMINHMVMNYGTYGAGADDTVSELLDKIEQKDPVAADRWGRIMALWKATDNDLELNYDVLPDGLKSTDELCLVVLGFQLNVDGTMKEELVQRLKVALASAEKYPNAYILCTGGGTAAGNASATEAGQMAKWLTENGISSDRVIVENRSRTTPENAIFSYEILRRDYPQVNQIAIISSDYHIATGVLLFGAETILGAGDDGREKIEIVSNAAWRAPGGYLADWFKAGSLVEISGDSETAYAIYYSGYGINDLPPIGD